MTYPFTEVNYLFVHDKSHAEDTQKGQVRLNTESKQEDIVRGIDLSLYANDVRGIVLSLKPRNFGIDPEDAIAQVQAQLLHKNQGKSPFDPTRAGPITYIWRVAYSTLQNMADKERRNPVSLRIRDQEIEDALIDQDDMEVSEEEGSCLDALLDDMIDDMREAGDYADCREMIHTIRMIREGFKAREIALTLNIPQASLKLLMKGIYDQARRMIDEKYEINRVLSGADRAPFIALYLSRFGYDGLDFKSFAAAYATIAKTLGVSVCYIKYLRYRYDSVIPNERKGFSGGLEGKHNGRQRVWEKYKDLPQAVHRDAVRRILASSK